MVVLGLTPDFFHLFVLCLSWQWDEYRTASMGTTVGKIARTLANLGVITEKQRRSLHQDECLQALFAMKVGFCQQETEVEGTRRDEILSSKKLLLVVHDWARDYSRELLLSTCRIYLTKRGKDFAASLETKYAHVITREFYLRETASAEETGLEAIAREANQLRAGQALPREQGEAILRAKGVAGASGHGWYYFCGRKVFGSSFSPAALMAIEMLPHASGEGLNELIAWVFDDGYYSATQEQGETRLPKLPDGLVEKLARQAPRRKRVLSVSIKSSSTIGFRV